MKPSRTSTLRNEPKHDPDGWYTNWRANRAKVVAPHLQGIGTLFAAANPGLIVHDVATCAYSRHQVPGEVQFPGHCINPPGLLLIRLNSGSAGAIAALGPGTLNKSTCHPFSGAESFQPYKPCDTSLRQSETGCQPCQGAIRQGGDAWNEETQSWGPADEG